MKEHKLQHMIHRLYKNHYSKVKIFQKFIIKPFYYLKQLYNLFFYIIINNNDSHFMVGYPA